MFCIDFSNPTNQLQALANTMLTGDINAWEREVWQFIANWFNPAVTHITIHTSGSTGSPKAISHSKQAMLNSAIATCNALQLQPLSNALLCLPANKVGGMMMIVRSIHLQMKLYCIRPSATPLNDLPAGTKIDFAALTPMQLHSATTSYEHFKTADAITTIILGGENVSAEILQLANRLHAHVYHTFGMTETISHIALKKLNGNNTGKHYKLLNGIRISTGPDNRLIIHAPALEQPELLTNDVVEIISDTEFDWLGRIDNVINTGGVKIHPEEMEQKLQPFIEPAFFIGALPNKKTGQQVVLALEMDKLSETDLAELNQALDMFSGPQRIRQVLLYKQFVRTTNGKIKRTETLQRPADSVLTY